MPYSYEYSPKDSIIFVRCEGELTMDEIFDYFIQIKNDPAVGSGAVELVDLADVRFFNVTHVEIPQMPEH